MLLGGGHVVIVMGIVVITTGLVAEGIAKVMLRVMPMVIMMDVTIIGAMSTLVTEDVGCVMCKIIQRLFRSISITGPIIITPETELLEDGIM